MIEFNKRLREYINLIEDGLESCLSADYFTGRESSGLDTMREVMAYSLAGGGKRIRPILTLEFCRACGGNIYNALPLACAVEMVHTYSLIHDDLPCMDDDSMRRGKPSSHKKFGYANALLGGDALLTLAFETVACADKLNGNAKAKAAAVLAKASGCSGMIAGQVMDLANENCAASLDEIRATDMLKTGAIIEAAAVMGCIAAEADDASICAAKRYCAAIGLAFQIVDDILDVTSDDTTLGKPVGSDKDNNKSTYVSLLGLEQSRNKVKALTAQAKDALKIYEDEGEFLALLADALSARSN